MIPVTYLEALLTLDKELKAAEEEILTGELNTYRSLLDNQSRGHFSSEVENVLEEVHSKWSELEKEKPTPTPSIRRGFKWKDFSKGYAPPKEGRRYWPKSAEHLPSYLDYLDSSSDRSVAQHLWYWEMTGTTNFVDRFIEALGHIVIQNALCEMSPRTLIYRDAITPNRFIRELLTLSELREISRNQWLRLVRNIVRRRVKTPLEQVARFLKFKLPWVQFIVRIDKPREDEITKDLVYICKNPDFDAELLLDVPITEEGQVIYLVICPSCSRKNKQGQQTCSHCGAGL